MILINGQTESRIEVLDRGLQYGDGLFETLAYRNNKIEFLEQHLQRLYTDSQRLNISLSESDLAKIHQELDFVCQNLQDEAVIKLIVTRGVGGRGYFAGQDLSPTRIISSHTLPSYPQYFPQSGITVRFCQHRLSENAILAGIKHLNRLDQVLGRNEWSDKTIAEGLMFDQHDNLIEGTMSNIFLVKSGNLLTPKLNLSGVAGVIRTTIIRLASENGLTVIEQTLSKSDLIEANEVFVCNSVNGIWPVNHIIDTQQSYSVGPITQQCQTWLSQAIK